MLSFLSTHKNCIKITEKLLSILKVKVIHTTLKNALYTHPNYPSLLAISDILTEYGVENISTQITIDKLTGVSFVPTFFINSYQLPKIYSVSD